MKITKLPLLIALFCLGLSMSLFAADENAAEMPPMGPTDEIKAMSDLIGTWDVKSAFMMSPDDTAWTPSTAVSVYSWIAGGGAIQASYESEFMGMPFVGVFTITYNRDSKMYQSTWIDNLGARISYYEGTMKDGKQIMEGKELYMGAIVHYRITTSEIKDGSFKWTMEQSMDAGKTYFKAGKATYTKRK